MAHAEWLRTFLAVYRTGSISGAASQRSLSQPALSQQLAALERSVGAPLFVRGPRGVEPTARGRDLYAEVVEPLSALEPVLGGLEAARLDRPAPALRIGTSPEYFSAEVLPRLPGIDTRITALFAADSSLHELLLHGELDLTVTSSTPPRRQLAATPIGTKRFVLVAAPQLQPSPLLTSLDELGAWLRGKPWVSYSLELPLTRRFWQTVLGRPFAGDLRLVVPDLRAAADAVTLGLGISLLPAYICAKALEERRIAELYPVSDIAPTEPWFATTRAADAADPRLTALVEALSSKGTAAHSHIGEPRQRRGAERTGASSER